MISPASVLLCDFAQLPLWKPQAIILREMIARPAFVSKSDIEDALWAGEPGGGPDWWGALIRNYIKGLRRKLWPRYSIETFHGEGYRLHDSVRRMNVLDQRLPAAAFIRAAPRVRLSLGPSAPAAPCRE